MRGGEGLVGEHAGLGLVISAASWGTRGRS